MQVQVYCLHQAETTQCGNSVSALAPAYLSPEHREMLAASAISPDVAEERGYRSVSAQEARLAGFSGRQRRAGLLIPMISPDGEVHYQLKPDEPRLSKDGKPIKYECPAGRPHHLDIHPRYWEEVVHGYGRLWTTEGPKKVDAAASRGEAAVGLTGVWNFGKKREKGGVKYGRPELLADWDAIPLEGREVVIAFDSDFRSKRSVALALLRLAERLTERGAKVYIASWPEEAGKGLDDYLAGGGSLGDLDVSPFTPSDLTAYVAREDGRVLGAVEATRRQMRRDEWSGMAGATDHSVLSALLELVLERGRVDKEGNVVVVVPSREGQRRAGIGCSRTLRKSEERLHERGYFRKTPGDRANGKANEYALTVQGEHTNRGERDSYPIPGFIPDSYGGPHLRWPAPAPAEDDPHAPTGDLLGRLGKRVELCLSVLVDSDGSLSLGDLSRASGTNHTYKLRVLLEPLAEAGVLELPEKGRRGSNAVVRLLPDWRKKLDEYREADGELAAGRRQAKRHRAERLAYELRHQLAADPVPDLRGKEAVGKVIAERVSRDAEARIERERKKVGVTPATFLSDALREVSGVRWKETRERWQEAGGSVEALRREVVSGGPFRFRREEMDFGKLYVERAAPAEAPAHPVEEHPVEVPPVEEEPAEDEPDWTSHPLDCECDDCSCSPPSYWRAWEPAMVAA